MGKKNGYNVEFVSRVPSGNKHRITWKDEDGIEQSSRTRGAGFLPIKDAKPGDRITVIHDGRGSIIHADFYTSPEALDEMIHGKSEEPVTGPFEGDLTEGDVIVSAGDWALIREAMKTLIKASEEGNDMQSQYLLSSKEVEVLSSIKVSTVEFSEV